MQVYFRNIFQAFSFKMTLRKSVTKSHFTQSIVVLYNVFKTFSYEETCKNERVTVLKHFYTVPNFKLSVKNKTSKSQRVRDKSRVV